jgi:hypothetical protein
VLSYHVHPGGVRASSSLPPRAELATRLGGAGTTLTVLKPMGGARGAEVRYRDADIDDAYDTPNDTDDADIIATDLTISGAPRTAGVNHVVHVIDEVMVPPAAGTALRAVRVKNGGRLVRSEAEG